MPRLTRVLVLAALATGVIAPAAAGAPGGRLARDLAGFWTYELQTPIPQNPFTSDNNRCHMLGHDLLEPLLPFAPSTATCTVKLGTHVFIGEISAECSTAEAPPFHGENEAQLRQCVEAVMSGFTTHTLFRDDTPVAVEAVQTRVMEVTIPPDNMLGVPAQRAQSVARGWVALLPALAPGVHHVRYTFAGALLGTPLGVTNTITLIVTP